ncbi:hypothetical protein FS837_002777 [Tulasnella sp. UAMH 9824]|nr:hypothetical protein FS837_002777 [Tulasnella sp. UAMH 9824]
MNQSVPTQSPPPVPLPPDHARDFPLALEEILRLILQFAEQPSLVAAARVCKFWSHIALDERWRSLPSISPLLELVAPRSYILNPIKYHQNLMSALAKADWGRFRYYSSRIKSIGVGQTVTTDLPPDSAGLVQLFHGPSPLLPDIKTVSWRFNQNQNCMSILPFIGPQLENLFLEMDEGIDNVAKSLLFQNLAQRVSTLKFLRLISSGFAHPISASLATLISSLPRLTHLELPPFFLTQEVVAAAAQLPLLTWFSHSKWTKDAESYHESGIYFEFMPESFYQLSVLSFASLPIRMAGILQSTDHVGRLRLVVLDCPAYNSPQEIENIFAALGSGAHRLETAYVVCGPVPQLAVSASKDSLTFDTIRPLFSCTQLQQFHLYAPHLTPPKDHDVVEMGKSWPAMWSLILCPTPLVKRHLGVDFNILPLFAKSFPNLQKLELFFGKGVPEFDGDLYPAYRFKKLGTLGLGFSRIPKGKTRDIGFLLASVCQHPPLIEYGAIEGYRGDAIPSRENADMVSACSEIKSSVDLAFRIKSSFARNFDTAGSAAEFYEKGLSRIRPST